MLQENFGSIEIISSFSCTCNNYICNRSSEYHSVSNDDNHSRLSCLPRLSYEIYINFRKWKREGTQLKKTKGRE